MELQQQHANRAEEHLRLLQDRSGQLLESAKTLTNRLASLSSGQRKLRRKADAILDVLLDISRPELTREEREWSREVENGLERVPVLEAEVEKVGLARIEIG